jgi:hypothetical protein
MAISCDFRVKCNDSNKKMCDKRKILILSLFEICISTKFNFISLYISTELKISLNIANIGRRKRRILYSTDHGKVNSPVRDGIPVPRDGIPVPRDAIPVPRDRNPVIWDGNPIPRRCVDGKAEISPLKTFTLTVEDLFRQYAAHLY